MNIVFKLSDPYEVGKSYGQFEANEGGWSSANQAEQAYNWWIKSQNLIDLSVATPQELEQFKEGWIDGFLAVFFREKTSKRCI